MVYPIRLQHDYDGTLLHTDKPLPEGFVLHPATSSDEAQLLILVKEAFNNIEELVKQLSFVIKGFHGSIFPFSFVVDDQRGICQSASIVLSDTPDLRRPHLVMYMTRPGFHRKGLARHAVAASVNLLYQNGFESIDCQTNSDNIASLSFAKSLGFREVLFEHYRPEIK